MGMHGLIAIGVLMVILLIAGCSSELTAGRWPAGVDRDLASLRVDFRSLDSKMRRLTVEATDYKLVMTREPAALVSLEAGKQTLPLTHDVSIRVNGKHYTQQGAARLNVWRNGVYYYEVHLLDVKLATGTGEELAAKGEIALYCLPDRVGMLTLLHPTADLKGVSTGNPITDTPAGPATAGDQLTSVPLAGGSLVWLTGDSAPGVRWWDVTDPYHPIPAGDTLRRGRTYGRFAGWTSASSDAARRAAVQPLSVDRMTVNREAFLRGFDPIRGVYVIQQGSQAGPVGFEPPYRNPNDYHETTIRVTNDGLARRLWMLHESHVLVGTLEAAVVCDPQGAPLPIPVQVSKNFAGENEEPDDTPFSEAYYPLTVQPRERLQVRSLHLMQNWGRLPLKQISSIRFFNHYYHLSTGCTETVCFSLFGLKAYPDCRYHVADYRGMDGLMWVDQPQFHHAALQGYLQYRSNGSWVPLRYQSTEWHAISPCFAAVTQRYLSEDEAIEATIWSMEAPDPQATRMFTRIRYEVKHPVTIDGDAAENLRLVVSNTDITRNNVTTLGWLAPDGKSHERPLPQDGWAARGEALEGNGGYCAMYASDQGNSAFILQRFDARIAGSAVPPVVSCRSYPNKVHEMFVALPGQSLQLSPGDVMEMDLIMMPYGHDASSAREPAMQLDWFHRNKPAVSVTTGQLISAFPAEVRAGAPGCAELEMSGGHGVLPLIVRGMPSWTGLMMFESDGLARRFMDQQAHGQDWYQPLIADTSGWNFAMRIPIRNGQKHRLFIGQVDTPEPIRSITARNQQVSVELARAGDMRIVSPRLWYDLDNRLETGRTAVVAAGKARITTTAPVLLNLKSGSCIAKLTPQGDRAIKVTLSGAFTGELRVLAWPHAPVTVTEGVQKRELTAGPNGTLTLAAEPGTLTIQLGR